MAQVNVSVSFQVDNPDEVQALIDQWVLHPGCTVLVSINEITPPQTTNEDGAIVAMPEPEPPPESLGEGGG